MTMMIRMNKTSTPPAVSTQTSSPLSEVSLAATSNHPCEERDEWVSQTTTTTNVSQTSSRMSTKRKQTETVPDEEDSCGSGCSMKERKLDREGVARSPTDTNQMDQEPETRDELSTIVTAPSTGLLINLMQWPHPSRVRSTAASALVGESGSSCEADPVMNEVLIRYNQPCPEERLPFVLRECFHSSLMTSLGLQPYFTISTINIIFDYLWTGPVIFGSRGFKFMQHWDKKGKDLPFFLYFPYESNRNAMQGLEGFDSNELRSLPIYHSLEMIGHLHVDQPPITIPRPDKAPSYWYTKARCDPKNCAWSHFKNKSADEIRLEDCHQMMIDGQLPPEFTDRQMESEKELGSIYSFNPFLRIWRFEPWSGSRYMEIDGTRLSMSDLLCPQDILRQMACTPHQVRLDQYESLKLEVETRQACVWEWNRGRFRQPLNEEEYANRCEVLEGIQTREQELIQKYANQLVLFKMSIAHKRPHDGEPYQKFAERTLGQTRQQYRNENHGNQFTDEKMNQIQADTMLLKGAESKYHAFSDKVITYSLRMRVVANGPIDPSIRTLYMGWSNQRIEFNSGEPLWESEFLISVNLSAAALIKVQIEYEYHPPDRGTQTMIITSLNHPSGEIYRSRLPVIEIEKVKERTHRDPAYHYSDTYNPLITCQLKEMDSSFNSSSSLTSESTKLVRQFMVTWLVDGIEVNQQPLVVNCTNKESELAFMDEVCQPILFTSSGAKYELCQELGSEPIWRSGYFPTNFDEAKFLPPPPQPKSSSRRTNSNDNSMSTTEDDWLRDLW